MRIYTLALVFLVVGCGDDGGSSTHHDAGVDTAPVVDALPDAPSCVPLAEPTCGTTTAPTTAATNGNTTCNPLTQTGCNAGEKCTWIVDQNTPQTLGHIGCAPDGTQNAGCACTYGAAGATGYDDCAKGNVCNAGKCKQVCDNQGGAPMCDTDHACQTYANLFTTGPSTPAAAGVCDVACNPLTENNFQGGPAADCRCGSALGCYGYPSAGTPPVTAFTCTTVLGSSATLVHRSQVTGTVFINSCAPGYLPLLRESTMSSTVVCIALCKPANCYAGNCGPGDANHSGAAPHRCMNPDARGTFDTSADGEHCAYLWNLEIDGNTGTLLPSPSSDEVGYCFDHSKYMYDSNGDNTPDTVLPPCKDLPDGYGSNATSFGALDLGCVDSSHLPPAAHAPRRPRMPDLRPFYGIIRE